MPIESVTITNPLPGATVLTTHVYFGTYTLDDTPLDKVKCRLVYPNSNPVLEVIALAANGRWDAFFPNAVAGTDLIVQAELYVQGVADRRDFQAVEDIDIVIPTTPPPLPPSPPPPLPPP